jgi:hypothetical protein
VSLCVQRFCLSCIEDCALYKPICPLCRRPFGSWEPSRRAVDAAFQSSLDAAVPLAARERRALDESKAQSAAGAVLRMRFVLGNEHVLLPSKLRAGVTHQWTVFLRARPTADQARKAAGVTGTGTGAKGKPLAAEDLIEKVEFTLHEDFGVGPIRLFKPPFEVTRKGYGEFTVPCAITWKRGLRHDKTVTHHTLNFSERITSTGFIVEFDPALVASLVNAARPAARGRPSPARGAAAAAAAAARGASRR